MIIDYKNFIAGNYIDPIVCDNMITYFENCKYKTKGKVSTKNNSDTNYSIKKSTDLHIQLHNNDKEIIAYSPLEMGCDMSDSYSYLDVKDPDQPMEHSFVFIKKGDQKIT